MTPKEKAEKLVNKFMDYADAVPEDYDWMDPVSHCNKKQLRSAKQCALIAVDEILSAINVNTGNAAQGRLIQSLNNYWEQVKQEIEKL
jgi:hypothetical protein